MIRSFLRMGGGQMHTLRDDGQARQLEVCIGQEFTLESLPLPSSSKSEVRDAINNREILVGEVYKVIDVYFFNFVIELKNGKRIHIASRHFKPVHKDSRT